MLLTLLRLTLLACVTASTDIHFGFVATDNSTATELITPLEIALELINNSSSILPGYQLNYVLWLSEVNCDCHCTLIHIDLAKRFGSAFNIKLQLYHSS